MRKIINTISQVLKAIAISAILLTVINYFYIIDFALTLILLFAISAILSRKFLKEKNKTKSEITIGIYLVIIIITIFFKVYSDSYNTDKSLNDSFYMLVLTDTDNVISNSDTLIFNFSDIKGYRKTESLKVLEKKNIKEREIFYVDYQFRPFNRICIGGIGYKDNKVNDIINYLGFGIKRIEIFENRIRLIDNGKEFNFQKIQ